MILLIPTALFFVAIVRQIYILWKSKKPTSEMYLFFVFNSCIIIGMWNTNVFVKTIFFSISGAIAMWTYYKK